MYERSFYKIIFLPSYNKIFKNTHKLSSAQNIIRNKIYGTWSNELKMHRNILKYFKRKQIDDMIKYENNSLFTYFYRRNQIIVYL